MGKMSKRKGAVGEREAAAKLNEVLGTRFHRGRQYQGGPGSPDLAGDLPGLHVEVKRCERLSLYRAMAQARRDASVDQVPAVMHRANGRGWLLVVAVEDLIRLLDVVDACRGRLAAGYGEEVNAEAQGRGGEAGEMLNAEAQGRRGGRLAAEPPDAVGSGQLAVGSPGDRRRETASRRGAGARRREATDGADGELRETVATDFADGADGKLRETVATDFADGADGELRETVATDSADGADGELPTADGRLQTGCGAERREGGES